MKWLSSLLCLFIGCVQVDDGRTPAPKPAIDTVDTPDQFAGVDKEIVAKLRAAPELQDSAVLRRYAAYCYGTAELMRLQTDVPLASILVGVKKSLPLFVGAKSPTLQGIAVGLIPESAGADIDREKIAEKWSALGLACHAAAHELDQSKLAK